MTYAPDSTAGRFLAGDRETLAESVRWISRTLAAPSFWSLRRDAGDLAQEVMGRVVESLRAGRFDAGKDFRAYVQGVARFTAFSALSRRPREVSTDEDDAPEPADDGTAGDAVEEALLARQLARFVLDRAGDECRRLITEYFLEQRSYAEISGETGTPVGTLKSRLFRCLDSARLAIGGRAAIRAARGPR